jgi:hypothetical protein
MVFFGGLSSAYADCASQFFVFAEQGLYLADRVQVGRGPIGAGQSAELGVNAKLQGSLVAPDITLRNNATVNGSAYTSTPIDLFTGAKVLVNTLPITSEQECSLPTPLLPQPGTGYATVDGGLELGPGQYGNVTVAPGATLVISTGDYHFESLTFEPDTQLRAVWDGGPATIIANRVSFGDRHRQSIDGGGKNALRVYSMQNTQLRLGVGSVVEAQIVAPFAEVNVPSFTHAYGRLYGKIVRVEPDSVIGKEVAVTPTVCQ